MSAIIFPVSYETPSSLRLSFTSLSSLLRSTLFAAPLFPNKTSKDLSQVTAGQQEVSSQDDTMLCSLPAALASTHHTIQHAAEKNLARAKVQPADYPPHNLQFWNLCFYSLSYFLTA